jgi:hypothetical protein
MSHELRTPLNAIGGYVQLVELGVHGPVTDAQRGALARVQAAQRHLLGLITDILDYAKVEGGRVEYDVRPVDAREVVAAVAPLVEPLFRAKGLAYAVRLPDAPVLVWADRERLGQVLVNLLSNAAKFTAAKQSGADPGPAGGAGAGGVGPAGAARGPAAPAEAVVVDLAERRTGPGPDGPDAGRPDVVFLRVRDTGRGIARDQQERVFEPFVQVGKRFAGDAPGTGLGLAISRDLARGMGGDLRVRSAAGEGSVFTVTLRRVVDAAGQPTDRRLVDDRDGGPRRTVRTRVHLVGARPVGVAGRGRRAVPAAAHRRRTGRRATVGPSAGAAAASTPSTRAASRQGAARSTWRALTRAMARQRRRASLTACGRAPSSASIRAAAARYSARSHAASRRRPAAQSAAAPARQPSRSVAASAAVATRAPAQRAPCRAPCCASVHVSVGPGRGPRARRGATGPRARCRAPPRARRRRPTSTAAPPARARAAARARRPRRAPCARRSRACAAPRCRRARRTAPPPRAAWRAPRTPRRAC